MENLTRFQATLIKDLTNEFDRLNPKVSSNKPKRFGVDTIMNCINEETLFIQSINAYNREMKKKLREDLDMMTDDFMAEYEEYFHLVYGQKFNDINIWHSLETFFDENKNGVSESEELYIYVASNSKNLERGSDVKDWCGGKEYFLIHVSFDLERVRITLDSGKVIDLNKIKGLRFSTDSYYLYRDKDFFVQSTSLDGLIQNSKRIQQRIVSMIKNK